MRIIDADEVIEHAWRDKLDSRELIVEMINNAPTVKEIPTKIPIDVFEKLISQESIKAVKQQPCEDCISREQAIKQCGFGMTSLHIADCLRKLSPVTPQPKIGHWIRVDKDKCKCDQCEVIAFIGLYPNGDKNYCPNCGAKMQAESE